MQASQGITSKLSAHAPRRSLGVTGRQRALRIRASDDEDIVPIFSGRRKNSFTPQEQAELRHPKLLGGKTIGDELAMIRERYILAEERAEKDAKEKLTSQQWDGDVYIGSRWNTLSILYLIFLAAPAAAGLFAWLSYGRLWGITPDLYS